MRERALATLLAVVAASTLVTAAAGAADQNWDEGTRLSFWFTPQGSRIIPYRWFLALEQSGSTTPFQDSANLDRLGYIPVVNGPAGWNPDALPIGFARSKDRKGEDWMGLTCAACHTARIEYKGRSMIVEGAPSMADFDAFYAGLVAAMGATLDDDAKFQRFSSAVLGAAPPAGKRDELRRRLTEQHAAAADRLARNRPSSPAGHARLDAFGNIFNEMLDTALGHANRSEAPDAPVSYPFLWDTPHHDRVQWNGSAPNGLLGLGPLARNTGEVIGVFGGLRLESCGGLSCEYPNNVEIRNLGRIEFWVKQLWSPKWDEAFLTKIDKDAAVRGKTLYGAHCEGCHVILRDRTDPDRSIKANMKDVGTDPAMATAAGNRSGATGPLKGKLKPGIPPTFGERDKADAMLGNGITGVLMSNVPETLAALREQRRDPASKGRELAFEAAPGALTTEELKAELDRLEAERARLGGEAQALMRMGGPQRMSTYKARPLNGIWATAPYLHNGSVPTLWDLLKMPAMRPSRFFVGRREFDPVDVGFQSASGPYEFDTSRPGNSNQGHAVGTNLEDRQKRDLIEFLKTL